MITGVCYPTHGTVEVHGRVSALLELSAGFDRKLTGRENIAFRGKLWGLSKEEIAELEPAIIDFAELGDYIEISGELKGLHVIDTTKCIKCGACISGCPKKAIVKE